MDNHTAEQKFENWKLVHRIVAAKNQETEWLSSSDFPYDKNVLTEHIPKKHGRYVLSDDFDKLTRCCAPPRKSEQIQSFLDEQDKFSVRRNTRILSDTGVPLVDYVRSAKHAFEPGLTNFRVIDPAELLLPPSQRLVVETDALNFPSQDNSEIVHPPSFSFSSNTLCTFGEWVISASGHTISRRKAEDIVNNVQNDETDRKIDLITVTHDPKLDQPEGLHSDFCNCANIATEDDDADQDILNSINGLTINFLRICTIKSSEVLCACTDGGRVFIFDLVHWIGQDNAPNDSQLDTSSSPNENPDNTLENGCLLLLLNIEESAWSIDIIDQMEGIFMVAIGNNQPGIALFVVDIVERRAIASGFLPTFHNVPTLSFLGFDSSKYRTTLTYGTITGDVSVIELAYNSSEFHVLFIDSQLLGDEVWTITPLFIRDFMPVSTFELLNLIFQENTKRSILYSTVMDTWIIDGGLPNPQCSSDLGPGVYTNTIPVPVTDLQRHWLHPSDVLERSLRFTTFDEDGLISKAICRQGGYDTNFSINYDQENVDQRGSIQLPKEDDNIKPFYFAYKERSSSKGIFSSDEDFRYKSLWKAEFPLNSTRERPVSSGNPKISFDYQRNASTNTKITHLHDRSRHTTLRRSASVASNTSINRTRESPLTITMNNNETVQKTQIFKAEDKRSIYPIIIPSPEDPDYASPGVDFGNFETSETDDRVVQYIQPNDYRTNPDIDHPFRTSVLQRDWTIHNHAVKVDKFIQSYLSGETTSATLSDYLLVTTQQKIILIKTSPLIVTSFTYDDIFPVEKYDFCITLLTDGFNRLNFTCHIPELNCIAVASQLGVISLIRLTEYKGLLSFRQEYILGWHPQDPNDPAPGDGCFLCSVMGQPAPGYVSCAQDDVTFPLFNITGMDYSYVPLDRVRNSGGYAILFVKTIHHTRAFKIYPGDPSLRI